VGACEVGVHVLVLVEGGQADVEGRPGSFGGRTGNDGKSVQGTRGQIAADPKCPLGTSVASRSTSWESYKVMFGAVASVAKPLAKVTGESPARHEAPLG
jgi:hypothetical protein